MVMIDLDPEYWLDNQFVKQLSDQEFRVYVLLAVKACANTLPSNISELSKQVDLERPELFQAIWEKLQSRFFVSEKNPHRLVHFNSRYVEPKAKAKIANNITSLYGNSLYGGTISPTTKKRTEYPRPTFEVRKLWDLFPKRANPGVYEKDSVLKLEQIVTTQASYDRMEAAIKAYADDLTKQSKGRPKDEVQKFTKKMNKWLMEEWEAWVPELVRPIVVDTTFTTLDEAIKLCHNQNWLKNFSAGQGLPWDISSMAFDWELEAAKEWTASRKYAFLLEELVDNQKENICPKLLPLKPT